VKKADICVNEASFEALKVLPYKAVILQLRFDQEPQNFRPA
jgi:hypothetical protein